VTAGARKQLENAEAASRQEQDDMETAENTGLTTSEPKLMFEERMVTVRDTLSELASSDDWEDGED